MAVNVTRMKQRYQAQNANRNMSDAELLKFEKEVNSTGNKILNFLGHGKMLTPKETQRLEKLHAAESAAKTSQKANVSTNKVEQSAVETTKQDASAQSAKGKSIFLENNGQN